eukprot:TRINITY_DN289_c0_g1_i1.p1 TRINITY_DN289_c0_g1~~TRINITY_DN289_c0_g1_i1.p1  ORF type:complete len:176 (-),score=23.64 TRINITY_DN289_c0_g1_i1:112-639(-)
MAFCLCRVCRPPGARRAPPPCRRPSPAPAWRPPPLPRAATLTMKKDLPPVKENNFGEKGLAAQGWTRWSETLNGRGAMLGLLIGFTVEQLSPQHLSIFEQVQTAVSGPAGLSRQVPDWLTPPLSVSLWSSPPPSLCCTLYVRRRDCLFFLPSTCRRCSVGTKPVAGLPRRLRVCG